MITRERMVQEDGAQWKHYNLERGGVILTSSGQELVHRRPEIWQQMREYRKKALGKTAIEGSGTRAIRQYIASGGNSDVYYMTPDLAVKEAAPSQSLFFALQRMDRLYSVIENKLPRWIDMPAHYGLLYSANLERQYMLMQCIDSGITVEDVLNTDSEELNSSPLVQREFGKITADDRQEIWERAAQVEGLISEALESSNLKTDDYLTDYHQGNVLIERLRTPIANSNFKLWVIDQ